MPSWTKMQEEAINKSGTNIIVSAGAGSGKTAVLTERVITKLKGGIKINELLILTFTNAAAGEMKNRIRKEILKNPDLKDNLDLLENSYITTFDSYVLSLIKKYGYLYNISPSLSIIDDGIIGILKTRFIDEIFDEYYSKADEGFNKFINDNTIKNDNEIKKAILRIISGFELKIDKDYLLDNYLDLYFNDDYLKGLKKEYFTLIKNEIDNIEINLEYLSSEADSDYYEKLCSSLDKLLKAKSYDEYINAISLRLPPRPKDSDEIKVYKENIDESIKIIKEYLHFDSEDEIDKSLQISKDYIKVILDIVKKYFIKMNKYKLDNDLYEFTDLELMAIKLLKEYPDICDELRSYYKEIMVDEYQDTNDIQEEFINLIANNNLYMVGDIKQSIYGFRNANPSIFKEKYDNYSKDNGGLKIDLLHNFRSRSEVLDNINEIFNIIMDDTVGGADYISSHQMVSGNKTYEDNKANQNYNLDIYNYIHSDNEEKEEEAFIIASDILDKIKNGYMVLDKDKGLIKCDYSSFCIIIDRKEAFDTYRKIFEYMHIPLTIYQDRKLTNEINMFLINNIIELILKIKNNEYDKRCKYLFMSISRSYLFEYNDKDIFNIIEKDLIKDTDVYKYAEDLSSDIDSICPSTLIKNIYDKFNIYEKLIKIGNTKDELTILDNILSLADNLSNMGYDIIEFKNYLDEMITSGIMDITYKEARDDANSVKLMNIHASKGLEFPICYYSGFYKKFNNKDVKDRFIFDNKYGIVTPYFDNGIKNTILKDLVKNKYRYEDVSEKIRLFYVALTRACEKMIMVCPIESILPKVSGVLSPSIRIHYKSFLDIITSISGNLSKYIINKEAMVDKKYLASRKGSKLTCNTDKQIEFKEIKVDNFIVEEAHASKTINKIINDEDKKTLEYGTFMHEVLENTDFNNADNSEYKDIILNLKESLNINENTIIYKEHEFIYEKDNTIYHGIIDLTLKNDNKITIVDYKLKNIDDEEYIKQLNVYKDYFITLGFVDIEMYLYSIIDNKLKKL